jgi:hypothetical protein
MTSGDDIISIRGYGNGSGRPSSIIAPKRRVIRVFKKIDFARKIKKLLTKGVGI